MSEIYDISDRYVEKSAALNPHFATIAGIGGHDREMADFSPQGVDRISSLDRETLKELSGASAEDERDRVLKEFMESALVPSIELHETGEHYRDIKLLGGTLQFIRMCFDQMPRETEVHWADIAARMSLVPEGLFSYRETLQEGVRRGLAGARRQAIECAGAAETWSGSREAPSYFNGLLAAYDSTGMSNAALRSDLEAAAKVASTAYSDMADYLRDDYAPHTSEADAVGRERYALGSRTVNGTDLDLDETYAWGWEQLRWVEQEMAATANKILPGGSVEEAIKVLDTDADRAIEGVENFRRWIQDLVDRTVSEMDGVHFDLPPEIKRIEALNPPPGGALAPHYTPPSEDLSRPGRVWFPAGERTRFPLWREVSTVYHEGVPGHHCQAGTTAILVESLSRYQRKWSWFSGHGEGWALYAERLMGELGYLENPDHYMGMLQQQALRCVRVIIDIGMHLELPIPAHEKFHPGETWGHDLGVEFMRERSFLNQDFIASEVVRYLGFPGQAISYKVGERAWLEAREDAKRRLGGDFDLKSWHNRALGLGPLGLDQMKRELMRT